MKIPSKIKIGSQVYDIYERNVREDVSLADAHAYTYTDGGFIVIDKSMSNQLKRRYLMHELLHALVFVFGQDDKSSKDERTDTLDNLEHWFIYLVQEPLVLLMRDNPKLVEYLVSDN